MWLLEKVPSQKAGFKPDSAAVVLPLNLNLPCRMELRMSVLLDPWDYLRNFRGNGPSGEKELTFSTCIHSTATQGDGVRARDGDLKMIHWKEPELEAKISRIKSQSTSIHATLEKSVSLSQPQLAHL